MVSKIIQVHQGVVKEIPTAQLSAAAAFDFPVKAKESSPPSHFPGKTSTGTDSDLEQVTASENQRKRKAEAAEPAAAEVKKRSSPRKGVAAESTSPSKRT